VESIERNSPVVYRYNPKSSVTIKSVDRAAFYQGGCHRRAPPPVA
jgi:hypothetical protein